MYLTLDEYNNFEELPDQYNFNKPYIIRGGCKDMKIFNIENKIELISNIFDDYEIDVELYDDKKDMQNTLVSFRDLKKFKEIYEQSIKEIYPFPYIADYNLKNIDLPKIIYEKINNLFKYNFDKNRISDEEKMFFGKNTHSGCHLHLKDDYILNQIIGTKTIYLFDFYDNYNYLTLENFYFDRSNFIKENIFSMNHDNLKLYKVVLNEGDSLTIPPWWWHCVKGNDLTLSITKTYLRTDFLYLCSYPYISFILFYTYSLENFIFVTSIILLIIIFIYYIFNSNNKN
jgi:hypothetical protein